MYGVSGIVGVTSGVENVPVNIGLGVRVLKIAKVKLGVLTKLMGSSVGDGEVLVAANSTGLSTVEQADKRDKPPIIRKLITLFIFPFQIYISF